MKLNGNITPDFLIGNGSNSYPLLNMDGVGSKAILKEGGGSRRRNLLPKSRNHHLAGWEIGKNIGEKVGKNRGDIGEENG